MPSRVWLSAATGEGVEALRGAIAEYLHLDVVRGTVLLGVADARLRALLHDQAHVLDERLLGDGGWEMDVELDRRGYEYLRRAEKLTLVPAPDPVTAAAVSGG